MKRTLAALALLVSACDKPAAPAAPTAAAPTPTPASPTAAMAGRPSPLAPPVDPKAVEMAKTLTDAKVVAYIGYVKGMSGAAQTALAAGANALAKAGGDKDAFAKSVQEDPNAQKLKAANDSALAQVGLSQEEVTGMGHLMGAYGRLGGMGMAMINEQLTAVRKRIADAKAQGKPANIMDTSMEKSFSDSLAKQQAQRAEKLKDFIATYGQPAADILEKHQAEYQAAAMAMAQSAFAKPAAPSAGR